MRAAALCVACAVLAWGCADKPLAPGIQTGASGTRLEAEKVVQLVYDQQPEAAIAKLPYADGDIAPAVRRMRQRWPEIKPYLDSGAVGMGSRGTLLLRQPGKADAVVTDLLKHENLDRYVLYKASRADVGHGDERGSNWSPYTELVFADVWAKHAPAGWWVQNEKGEWLRKEAAPAK
jgi:hypothetical protein